MDGAKFTKVELASVIGHAESLARHLTRSHTGFGDDDRNDIVQELLTAIIQAWDRFDPNRSSWKTFADRVMRNRRISLIRRHRAGKRDWKRRRQSIDEESHEDAGRHTGWHHRCEEEISQLRMDFDSLLDKLPDTLRDYADLRRRGLTHEAARKSLRRSRREVDRVKDTLLQIFEQAGLREYL